MLKINGAIKVFEPGTPSRHVALDGASLTLNTGDFVTVIGSNGAGKSTLFNAIAGNFWLDSGRIELDGQDITYAKEHHRARHIGRLFQNPAMGTAPDLTIGENLALVYAKSTRRFPLAPAMTASDRQYFVDVLARLDMGIEDRMKTNVGQLSGGQRQAVTLLIATLVPPKLLMLDEHTAALDPVSAEKVMGLTREITGEHKLTTLMITHNIAEALKTGNRTIMMHKGKIVMDLAGEERARLTVPELLRRYKERVSEELDNDRMLLAQ